MSYQLLPRDASSPIPQPITTSISSSTSRRRGFLAFFGTAAATGIIFHLILLGFGAVPNSSDRANSLGPSSIKDWWSNTGDSPLDLPPKHIPGSTEDEYTTCPLPPTNTDGVLNNSTSYIRPGLGQLVVADEDEWSIDKIRKMVEGTKGYYVRDYSLGLGWNNVGHFYFILPKSSNILVLTCLPTLRCGILLRRVFSTQIFSTGLLSFRLLYTLVPANGTCQSRPPK